MCNNSINNANWSKLYKLQTWILNLSVNYNLHLTYFKYMINCTQLIKVMIALWSTHFNIINKGSKWLRLIITRNQPNIKTKHNYTVGFFGSIIYSTIFSIFINSQHQLISYYHNIIIIPWFFLFILGLRPRYGFYEHEYNC